MASIERLGLLLLSVLLVAADEDVFVFLHSVPLELRAEAPVDLERPVRIEIRSRDPGALAAANRLPPGSEIRDDGVIFDLAGYPELTDEPDEQHLRPSFVIDYDEPPVAELAAELRAKHGERPSPDSLADFVHQAIRDKSGARGWDVASVVAARREGDCTEHAVLATALARATGTPARVVVGVVIFGDGERTGAFGHAWSEVHDGARWRLVDATRIADTARVRYVREGDLDTEGTGFGLGLTNISTRTRSIAILGPGG